MGYLQKSTLFNIRVIVEVNKKVEWGRRRRRRRRRGGA